MKREKNKNIIIAILLVIVIILTILVVLFATGTISLNSKTDDSDVKANEVNENSEENNVLTEEEAKKIVKEKFLFTEKYLDDSQLYCGENSEIDYSVQKDGMPYYKSSQFKTLDELDNYLSRYMSDEVKNKKVTYNADNFITQNGSLYCLLIGAGDTEIFEEEKAEYNINEISKTKIDVIVKAYYDTPDGEINKNISVTLDNVNDNWIITKYEEYN